MQLINLYPTSGRPLSFAGKILAEASDRRPGDTCWAKVELYRTNDHELILSIHQIAGEAGEADVVSVYQAPDPAAMIERVHEAYGKAPELILHLIGHAAATA